MSVWPIALRVLLAVSLILNGSGYAVASGHTQTDHAALASTTSQPIVHLVATAEPPCAEHHQGVGSMASETPPADAAMDAASVKSGQPSPDCCETGVCRDACVHQAQAAVPAVAFQQAVVEHVDSVSPMKSGHASPAIPHLIRPPIG